MQRRPMLAAQRVGVHLLLGAACVALLALAGCAAAVSPARNAPAPSPTAAPSVSGPLASIVGPLLAGRAQRGATTYDASTGQATIILTIPAAPDVATAQTRVMTLCYDVQKALWASNRPLRGVKVIVLGPLRDDYADIIEDAYGVAEVQAPTAAKLSWNSLSPEVAWNHYDNTWLRASYLPNWLYGHGN